MTVPSPGTESIGLRADAHVSWFLQRHLDYFIVTQNSQTLPGLCTIWTDPAAGTKSIGLAADAHGVMVFANPSRLFHRAPGLTILTRTWSHLDSFIVLPDSSAICRDLQKPRHRDTDANSIKPPDCYM